MLGKPIHELFVNLRLDSRYKVRKITHVRACEKVVNQLSYVVFTKIYISNWWYTACECTCKQIGIKRGNRVWEDKFRAIPVTY